MADGVDFMAETIERRQVADLVPYARNSRVHSPESVSQLAAGMREFGWTTPILIDEKDGIIAGHGRVMAAQKLKLPEVPVIVARGWSDEKKRAYVIWDNKSSELSSFDKDILRVELSDLQGVGFDLSLTGFSSLELRGIFATQDGNTDPDEVPDAPAAPVSVPGDLWRLGEHWLVCGDCTDKTTVEAVLGGAKPHLMVTDPPYGVNYNPNWRNEAFKDEAPRAKGKRFGRAVGEVLNDGRADWREAWCLFPGEVAYVWHGHLQGQVVGPSLEAAGFELRAAMIWNKTSMAIGRGHYHWKHEACFYAVRKGGTGHWAGDRKQNTVWDIDHRKSETGHGTQKPVEAMARPLRNNSQPGDHVYEPFSGSGTTIIACQMNKRIAHAIELNPAYVDVAVTRFAAFSGLQPILAETGETFEQVKARRAEVV